MMAFAQAESPSQSEVPRCAVVVQQAALQHVSTDQGVQLLLLQQFGMHDTLGLEY